MRQRGHWGHQNYLHYYLMNSKIFHLHLPMEAKTCCLLTPWWQGRKHATTPQIGRLQGLLGLWMERDQMGIYILEVNALSRLSAPILCYPKHRAWLTLLLDVEPHRLLPACSEGDSQEILKTSLNIQKVSRSNFQL